MTTVIAIDPGTTESGVVIWDGKTVLLSTKMENHSILHGIKSATKKFNLTEMVIEQIRSYGKPVGQEIFDTCVWCGKFEHEWNRENRLYPASYIPRIEVKKHLCHRHIADDAQIRQVLIDRFGPKPTKKKDNPVYGGYKLANDEWQSFALAVTYIDQKGA